MQAVLARVPLDSWISVDGSIPVLCTLQGVVILWLTGDRLLFSLIYLQQGRDMGIKLLQAQAQRKATSDTPNRLANAARVIVFSED